MSEAAPLMIASPLRVFVDAAASRRAALLQLIVRLGYHVAASAAEADVVLAAAGEHEHVGRPVVRLGGYDDNDAGVLPMDADPVVIDAALRAVGAGLTVRAANRGFRALPETPLDALLTPREIDVLMAIGDGLTNKAIARKLDISLHTVKFHIESVFRKLGARTRTEALAKARGRDPVEL